MNSALCGFVLSIDSKGVSKESVAVKARSEVLKYSFSIVIVTYYGMFLD